MYYKETNRLSLSRALNGYVEHLILDIESKSTIVAYNSDIKQFFEFCSVSQKSLRFIQEIELRHTNAYRELLLNKVKNGVLKHATQVRKLDSLRAFYKYLSDYKEVDNIMKSIKPKRLKKDGYIESLNAVAFRPTYLSQNKAGELLQKLSESTSSTALRDYAMVRLMLETGCRRCSVLAAKWEDIDIIGRDILIRDNKNKKQYRVPISKELLRALLLYKTECKGEEGKIFLSNRKSSLSTSSYNKSIKAILKLIGVEQKRESGHVFRHTFIMLSLMEGKSPTIIIRFTGHASVDSIAPYISLLSNDIRNMAPTYDAVFKPAS